MASTTDEALGIQLWFAIFIVTAVTIIVYLLLEILILQFQIFQIIDEIPSLIQNITLKLDEIAVTKAFNNNWHINLQEKTTTV